MRATDNMDLNAILGDETVNNIKLTCPKEKVLMQAREILEGIFAEMPEGSNPPRDKILDWYSFLVQSCSGLTKEKARKAVILTGWGNGKLVQACMMKCGFDPALTAKEAEHDSHPDPTT